MSKHHKHEECCYPMYGGYQVGGYTGGSTCGGGIRWIYALLILIVIVLQFGRNNKKEFYGKEDGDGCGCGSGSGYVSTKKDDQLIDNSVLFIIIVFLLILCAGCFGKDYGFGGGYGF